MKQAGRPGLDPLVCQLWKEHRAAMEEYHRASLRASRFGVNDEKRIRAAEEAFRRAEPSPSHCPRFKPTEEAVHRSEPRDRRSPLPPPGAWGQCRFYYLEACLLLLPPCPGHCEEFLPVGDQVGGMGRETENKND
jgi:hypothetical protein